MLVTGVHSFKKKKKSGEGAGSPCFWVFFPTSRPLCQLNSDTERRDKWYGSLPLMYGRAAEKISSIGPSCVHRCKLLNITGTAISSTLRSEDGKSCGNRAG